MLNAAALIRTAAYVNLFSSLGNNYIFRNEICYNYVLATYVQYSLAANEISAATRSV